MLDHRDIIHDLWSAAHLAHVNYKAGRSCDGIQPHLDEFQACRERFDAVDWSQLLWNHQQVVGAVVALSTSVSHFTPNPPRDGKYGWATGCHRS